MIRNRPNRIPHPALAMKWERIAHNLGTARAESQVDKCFRADDYYAILNKITKTETTRKRTNIDNQNKPQQTHRLGTVSNK